MQQLNISENKLMRGQQVCDTHCGIPDVICIQWNDGEITKWTNPRRMTVVTGKSSAILELIFGECKVNKMLCYLYERTFIYSWDNLEFTIVEYTK